MRQKSNVKSMLFGRSSAARKLRYLRLPVAILVAASLTACANLLEEFKAQEAAKTELRLAGSAAKLPDMPAELRTCLLKQACQEEAQKAKAASKPAPQCTTADGIVLAYVQSDREKRACAGSMIKWYREQQRIQESASNMKKDDGHPRSTKPKSAQWP